MAQESQDKSKPEKVVEVLEENDEDKAKLAAKAAGVKEWTKVRRYAKLPNGNIVVDF